MELKNMNKKQKKERKLRSIEIYENKIDGEYVRWIRSKPTYSPFEWVEYMSK